MSDDITMSRPWDEATDRPILARLRATVGDARHNDRHAEGTYCTPTCYVRQRHLLSDYGWPDERFTPEVVASLTGQHVKVTAPTHDWTAPFLGVMDVISARLEDDGLHLWVEADDRSYDALADGDDRVPLPISIGFRVDPDGAVTLYDVTRHSEPYEPVGT